MKQTALEQNPIKQFLNWYQQAVEADQIEPDAMSFATVDENGQPAVRIVLYKGMSDGGFLFYTNYKSRKGKALLKNPKAAIVFYWPKTYRQVRVEGLVKKAPVDISEAYFRSRSRDRQISATISPQSQVVEMDRGHLDSVFTKFEQSHRDQEIQCPEHWGGYILEPATIEFWDGSRDNRLHDRFLYTRTGKKWEIARLAP